MGTRATSPKPTKDPKGGLTAAGRAMFAKKEHAHLKPGVQKPAGRMSMEEKKRKGSWAVRFYGRKGKLPPLRDAKGEPTRFALTAHAWGERVPRTVAEARAIATKGRRLLAEARRHEDAARPRARERKKARSKTPRAKTPRAKARARA